MQSTEAARDALEEALLMSNPKKIRIVSYNICGFGAGFGPAEQAVVTSAYGRLRSDLCRMRPDVLCLNEVKRMPLTDPEGQDREDSLAALASDLGGMEFRFAHANPGFENFGNAVLVGPKLRILGSDSAHLNGGSSVKLPNGALKHIGRGCVAVHLAVHSSEVSTAAAAGEQKFAVLTTHWDHLAEDERLKQALSAIELAPHLTGGLPHILIGDLNAMKRSDYTDAERDALEARNRQRGWKMPEDSTALRALEAAGYADVLEQRFPYIKQMDQLSGSSSVWTMPGEVPTRIDYAFASAGWPQAMDGASLGSATLAGVDVEATGSDHFPLVIDLSFD